ncbi:MAG: MoaF N-terminal domain [Thermoplasmata archaeon]|jgi:hypothetical protein|nr:MoaF N-terminal domain [Thermoplasmata archaeon]MEA3165251.1 MoaF N-terminal domain [Thermoplasmata archaeon]
MDRDPLRGKTLRWTFQDGPTAGTTYEHEFGRDGKVAYRQVGGASGEGHRADYEVVHVRSGIVAVSYLAPSGFTLTSLLDFDGATIVAFASNEKQLVVQHGTFEHHAGARPIDTSVPPMTKEAPATKAAKARPTRPARRGSARKLRVP